MENSLSGSLKRTASCASMSSEGTIDYGVSQHDVNVRGSVGDPKMTVIDAYLDGSVLKFVVEYHLGVWWKAEEMQAEMELVSDFMNSHRDKAAELPIEELDGYWPRETLPGYAAVKRVEDVAMLKDELYVKVVPWVFMKYSDVLEDEDLRRLAQGYLRSADWKIVLNGEPNCVLP
ncbi:hypothetical protein NKR23_g2125 [Pleurostoma richardsiae]|uniref:Uncharacterized protein n=1 Tax=Pleurostoma richardsiae TaxID=41990 RepID=A0AA38VVV2_9PEZI|nr:hypothetical protein NKR23_g2125 [Pleurostoma richardsiae]